MNEQQARERIKELRDYYGHLTAYVAVNLMLLTINLLSSPDHLWFLYPLLGWGIGMAIHTGEVFWTGASWEQRKLEELTGLQRTQADLKRLSERTDALVTVLASVDWNQIDPELVHTRDALTRAQARLRDIEADHDADQQVQVEREIEQLEEFVTSPRFTYYERAAE